jgi:uncharacterized OB-fold protein
MDLTAPFWAAAGGGVLVRPVCRTCGRNFFTPQIACPSCLSEDWDYAPSSGRGTVYSATVVHKAPSAEFEVPYSLAVVDLDEGWSMLANVLPDADGRIAAIGDAVQLTWIERAGRTLPAFRGADR